MDEKIFAASLNALSPFGPRYLKRALEHFGSFREAWDAPAPEYRAIKDFSPEELAALKREKTGVHPETVLQELEKNRISLILKEELPQGLLQTPVPPELLYVQGSLPNDLPHSLGVVGARRLSMYGKESAEKIISGLASSGIVIVSGLARGIDAAAHEAALRANLKTVAVLGSGMAPQVLFPKENRPLAKRIVETGGAVISEYPFRALPLPWQFPERNRIIAGLSRAVLIIEAREKSGALITANFAVEYNRDVLAVPGSIFSENSKGPNALLHAGAAPARTSLDILRVFGIEYENFAENALTEVSEAEKKILDFLSSPLSRDELIRQSGLHIQDAIGALTLLEMRGIVREAGGEIMKIR